MLLLIRITILIQGLFSGFVTIGRHTQKVVNGHKSAAASSHSFILIHQMAAEVIIKLEDNKSRKLHLEPIRQMSGLIS